VAGSGAEAFETLVSGMPAPADDTITPDLTALTFSGELMSREILTGEPIRSGFGGAYEVLYCDVGEFQKIDNLMHVFIRIDVGNTKPQFQVWSHVIRQWYDEERLCVASPFLVEDTQ
jgi:hypothetical protein